MSVFEALLPIFTEYGYLAVFVMLLICGFGVPVPEDVTLVTGGVIAGLGYADPERMLAVGLAGVMIGDGLVFCAGRFYGERVLRWRWCQKVLTPERFAKTQEAFEKYGRWVMFVARFLPGLRTPVFFSAGMSRRVSFATWFFMDGLAAILSVPIWIYLGYYGARNWDWMWGMVRSFQTGIFVALGVGLVVLGVWWWRRRAQQAAAPTEP
jgi:membrane protein DedA with SNARE-associated domain